MEKENLKEEFLKSLKIALNNSSIYFKDHPLVLKSIEDLYKKIKDLNKFIPNIKIIASKDTLFLENKLEDSKLNRDLAEFLHFRKIKSIEFYNGVSFEELSHFIFNLGKPIREIFKAGGLESILKNKDIKNIVIEELDYSELLLPEGEELKDIWIFLLKDSINKDKFEKIDLLVDNFLKILYSFNSKKILEDKDFKETIFEFFEYLKEKDNKKLVICSRELFRFLLKNDIDIKDKEYYSFFKNLSNLQFSEILIDVLTKDTGFDEKALILFLSILKLNKKDLEGFEEKFRSLSLDLKTKRRIKKIFFESNIKDYNYDFSFLLKYIEKVETALDFVLPFKNYFNILLYLLKNTSSKNTVNAIVNNFISYWDDFTKLEDANFLKELFVLLLNKKSLLEEQSDFIYKITRLIEEKLIEERLYFKDFLEFNFKNTYDFKFYFDIMFNQNKVNPNILFLCFNTKDFDLFLFLKTLKIKKFNINFLHSFIDSIKNIDLKISYKILKYIYDFSNVLIKIKILSAMECLSFFDENFLYNLLKDKNKDIRKNAIKILLKNNRLNKKTLNDIFCIFNPFGIRDQFIIENINIMKELKLEYLIKDLKCLKKFKNLLKI